MGFAGMHTGGKGVEAADAVGKPLFFEEFEGAVGDGGLVAETFGGEAFQDIIGAHRAVAFGENLQRALADGGQADATFCRQSHSAVQHMGAAMVMIMPIEWG